MKFIATCKLGLESLVTRQLHDLDIEVLEIDRARGRIALGWQKQ